MSVRKRTWITRRNEHRESWVVDYTDQHGDRHIHTFARKKEADEYHATVKVDVRHGVHTAPGQEPTVAEAAENWIKRVEAEGRERGTLAQYRQHVNLHIGPRIGRYKLAHLTPARVEAFRDDLLKSKSEGGLGLSRPMARKVLTSLKSLLKVAKHAHVAADVSIGAYKRKRKLEIGVDIPSPDEIRRLLKAAASADIRPRTLLIIAVFTGLRASELRGLRWKDVDFKHNEIHVRQRADRYCAIGAPKSESGNRTVDFDGRVATALKEWKLRCPKGEADLVFPTSTGRVEHHRSMLSSLDPVLLAAGLVDKEGRPKYALHTFRHFFASWCLNRRTDGGRELPAKNVQELLGHSTIGITLDVYGHLFRRNADDRAELAASTAALLA
jgi:integrase